MAKEQTFSSPGFFDREIDLSGPVEKQPVGIPFGVIGTAKRGPAFVPVTVGDADSFVKIFGDLHKDHPASYAADRFFKAKSRGEGALTFCRVLGAGSNETEDDISNTQNKGIVKNAGFKIVPGSAGGQSELFTSGSLTVRFDADLTAGNTITLIDANHTSATLEFRADGTTTGGGTNPGDDRRHNVKAVAVGGANGVAAQFRATVNMLYSASILNVSSTLHPHQDSSDRFDTVVLHQMTSGTAGNTKATWTITSAKATINTTQANGSEQSTNFIGGHDGKFTRVHDGAVQFIVAQHFVSGNENTNDRDTAPDYTYNDSFGRTSNYVSLVRAMIMCASGTRFQVASWDDNLSLARIGTASLDVAKVKPGDINHGEFKLILSSTSTAFSTKTILGQKIPGRKVFSASLDPSSDKYIGKILNTDPARFGAEEHLLYADFTVESELATVSENTMITGSYRAATVAIMSGTSESSSDSGDTSQTFLEAFGRFDTRFTTPRTPKFISQPFGAKEYDLFTVESVDDGAYANEKYKISISNIKASEDPNYDYGTFTLQVRDFNDTDNNMIVFEEFGPCTLDPNADNFIARLIGDKKVIYNFDSVDEEERRLVVQGKYGNNSRYIRVLMESGIEVGDVPKKALPFGFRGIPTLKTNVLLIEDSMGRGHITLPEIRINAIGAISGTLSGSAGELITRTAPGLSGSIVPPLPFRFKVTKGEMAGQDGEDSDMAGAPGKFEKVDSSLYWGVKFERVPETGSLGLARYKPNNSTLQNPLVRAYTKFLGISKFDVLVTGSHADTFSHNKFTLANVAFANKPAGDTSTAHLTGTIKDHMLEAAYVRNGSANTVTYAVEDPKAGSGTKRITFATLLNRASASFYNRFSKFAKFSTIMYGGFDGVNILTPEDAKLGDRATSTDSGGQAASGYTTPGFSDSSGNAVSIAGTQKDNSAIQSYKAAIKIMTDQNTVNINVLAVPGIREPGVTDYAMDKVKEYALAMYVLDIQNYDDSGAGNRLYMDETTYPDVQNTVDQFDTRNVDNNYAATYFPDVTITDDEDRGIQVPASIAAIGALSFNDDVRFPWFAPAGFNRASLDFVQNARVRLNSTDRDDLYNARINPIATFPREGYVIFGQKTLQLAKTALDRVNVRRLLLEVKRSVIDIARALVFEQNNSATREKFVARTVPLLAVVQAQAGIEKFKVIMDGTNNTQEDIENNVLNGRIVLVPTRAVEFIAVDFIITNAGVEFV